ncbi:hypothetical protein K490DRAFT_18790, partial [Saccharata proteae CBS 121410]
QGQPQRAVYPSGHPMMTYGHGDSGLTALTHGLGGMSIHPSVGMTKTGSHMSSGSSELGGVPLPQHFQAGHHPMMMPAINNYGPGMPHSPNMQAPLNHYMPSTAYQYATAVMDNNSPVTTSWASRVSSGEAPSLVTPRRDSVSSNEQDLPGTPYTGNTGYHTNVAYMDRSPSAMYNTNSGTPSPSHLGPYYVSPIAKVPTTPTIPMEMQLLLQQDPAIPRAIPAPSSPIKPLDKSLENKNGETNVYIRGLLPETTDDMLRAWGARFGDIQSSKSIIDVKTNLCKGFGFIKYYNFPEAENCIRGFHYLGYEVSFARESFYAKLKKFSDDNNTNLYVSNIPRNVNECELKQMFHPFVVCSSKVLRDSGGHGRGVGFARFETRDICEEVINKFNNKPVPVKSGEECVIQIRYADTQEQKVLKAQTQAARQFRAAEFEYGVLQSRTSTNGLMVPEQRLSGLSGTQHDAANEFERFL